MSLHSFDPDIAIRVGVNAATIYQNILFWTKKNIANGKHIHDGFVWTYNSVSAMNELFPYLSPDQIRRALSKLVEDGLIAEGNYNTSGYDRTKWYGVNSQIHLAKTTNGFGENHKPIPDSKPDNTILPNQGEKTDIQGLSEKLYTAAGITDETKSAGLLVLSEPLRWLENGCDLEKDVLPTIRSIAARGAKIGSWAYCTKAVFQARDSRLSPAPEIVVEGYRGNGQARTHKPSVAEIAMRKAGNV